MPAEKPLPAPHRIPTWSSGSASSSSIARPTPSARAALTALRWSGRLSVTTRTPSRRSVSTAGWSFMTLRLREQHEVRLALAAQHGEVDLDPGDPARLGEHPRLRLDRLRREHAAAAAERRVGAQPLEIAGELLDRVDRPDAL